MVRQYFLKVIPEWETNYLYFSNLLPVFHPKLWAKIEKVLKELKINFSFLLNTKDIWCRDYMPVQVTRYKLIQFKYDPTYLNNFSSLKTNPYSVITNMTIKDFVKFSDLILDGGSLVFSKNTILISDFVFKENTFLSKEKILNIISELLEVDRIFVVPHQPYNYYGHSDSMVSFIDDYSLLVYDYSSEPQKFKNTFRKFLEKLPFNLVFLRIPYQHRFNWCYINYIQCDKKIIVPIFGHPKEDRVLCQFQEIFKDYDISTVKINSILTKGGGLHCISWNLLL